MPVRAVIATLRAGDTCNAEPELISKGICSCFFFFFFPLPASSCHMSEINQSKVTVNSHDKNRQAVVEMGQAGSSVVLVRSAAAFAHHGSLC